MPCPVGSSCPGRCVAPSPCNEGTYSAALGAQVCPSCPVGSYALQKGSSTCTPCPSGSYCTNSVSRPFLCSPGHFSAEYSISCTACALGKINFIVLFYNIFLVEKRDNLCMIGSYAIDYGSPKCNGCPSGSACPNANSLPIPCSLGQYSPRNSNVCIMCAPGMACPTTLVHLDYFT